MSIVGGEVVVTACKGEQGKQVELRNLEGLDLCSFDCLRRALKQSG